MLLLICDICVKKQKNEEVSKKLQNNRKVVVERGADFRKLKKIVYAVNQEYDKVLVQHSRGALLLFKLKNAKEFEQLSMLTVYEKCWIKKIGRLKNLGKL